MGLSSTHPGYHHLPVREICLDNYNCCRHQHEATYIPLLNNWSKEDKDRDKSNLYSWSDIAFVSCSPVAAVLLHLQLGPVGGIALSIICFTHFLNSSSILYMRMRCWSVASNKSDLSNASGGVLVWPIHFAPDHIFLSHSLVVDYVLFSILMQSSCCCLTTLNTRTRTEDADRVGQSISTMLRMFPQQHGHLHPIDLRLVSSTRDPNNSASSTRVQVPEEISTLVPTNPLGEVQSSHWSDWR